MHTFDIVEAGKPINKAKRAVIALHGRGGNASNFISVVETMLDEDYYIIAPQATNDSWYPNSFMAPESENQPWLDSAVDIVQQIVKNTKDVLPGQKVFMVGFSQGACLALEATSRKASLFGGVIAFTGGLIGEAINHKKYSGDFGGSNVYLSNSFRDPHVPLSRSRESVDELEKLNAQVILDLYEERPHTILKEELEKVKDMFFF